MADTTLFETDAVAHPSLARPRDLYIGGNWVAPRDGGSVGVTSAHSEAEIERVALAGPSDMDAAVAAAREAFDNGPWPRLSPSERAAIVGRLGEALGARLPEIAGAWVDQIGSLVTAAPFVMGGEHGWFAHYVDLAERFEFEREVQLDFGPGTGLIVREPVGVAVAITPWNNPYGIMVGKIVPALIAGCTVIMKPAPETPIEAYIIAEAADAIGLPAGVLNLVPAGREAAEHLVSSPGVDKVSFTGSVLAGRRIASICGNKLARVTLELGGKSAAIVLDDYGVSHAAAALARTITLSAGQVCATLSRVIVHESRAREFVDATQAAMSAIRVGSPYDPASEMGPLAMGRQLERVEQFIAAGTAEGATLVTGGGRPLHLDSGYYIEPTLFADVTPDMTIAKEEIFGPVLSVLTFRDDDEAVRLANATDFGLYGAVFSNDSDRAYRVARGMRAGTISQNEFRFDKNLPFGGFKSSGIGREGGQAGLESFTEQKSIILATGDQS